jgi:hypothetical protein
MVSLFLDVPSFAVVSARTIVAGPPVAIPLRRVGLGFPGPWAGCKAAASARPNDGMKSRQPHPQPPWPEIGGPGSTPALVTQQRRAASAAGTRAVDCEAQGIGPRAPVMIRGRVSPCADALACSIPRVSPAVSGCSESSVGFLPRAGGVAPGTSRCRLLPNCVALRSGAKGDSGQRNPEQDVAAMDQGRSFRSSTGSRLEGFRSLWACFVSADVCKMAVAEKV